MALVGLELKRDENDGAPTPATPVVRLEAGQHPLRLAVTTQDDLRGATFAGVEVTAHAGFGTVTIDAVELDGVELRDVRPIVRRFRPGERLRVRLGFRDFPALAGGKALTVRVTIDTKRGARLSTAVLTRQASADVTAPSSPGGDR